MHPRPPTIHSQHNLHSDQCTKRCRPKDPKCAGSEQRSSVCRARNQSKPLSAPSHSSGRYSSNLQESSHTVGTLATMGVLWSAIWVRYWSKPREFLFCSGPVKTSYRQPFLPTSSSITIKHTATPPRSLSTSLNHVSIIFLISEIFLSKSSMVEGGDSTNGQTSSQRWSTDTPLVTCKMIGAII